MKSVLFNNQLLIILIIVLILIIHFKSNPFKENFIVLVDDENPTKENCPEYLIYDGSFYYLLDSRKAMSPENPRRFTSMGDVELYLEKEKPGCKRPTLKSTVVEKKNEDPRDTYAKTCNRKIAIYNHRINSCIDYNQDIDAIRGYEKLRNDKVQAANYFLEECQVDRVNKENLNLISDMVDNKNNSKNNSKNSADNKNNADNEVKGIENIKGLDLSYQLVSNQMY